MVQRNLKYRPESIWGNIKLNGKKNEDRRQLIEWKKMGQYIKRTNDAEE